MQLLTIVAMLVAIVSVIFAMQNNVPVTVTFLVWRFDSSLALVLLAALAIGMLIVALVSTPATIRRQWVLGRQNKRIAELEKANGIQKATIAELESRLPATEPPAPEEEKPYIGLKEIIAGAGSKGTQEPPLSG